MVLQTTVNEEALAPLVGAEEEDGGGKGAAEGREQASVQASADALLPPDGVVGLAERRVFGGDVGVALLARLDGVERVHEQVAGGAADATSNHGLVGGGVSAFVACSGSRM